MANIKWTGIENYKYGLTARWYVDAYYGNDIDVDAVGYYNPSTNPTGHGGPTRPFASYSKLMQDSNVVANSNVVFGSGIYGFVAATKKLTHIGDGTVVISNLSSGVNLSYCNTTCISCVESGIDNAISQSVDARFFYCSAMNTRNRVIRRCVYYDSSLRGSYIFSFNTLEISNTIFINCQSSPLSEGIGFAESNRIFKNNIIINSPNLRFVFVVAIANFLDWSVIFGSINSQTPINGKTSGVTIEDFKADGRWFIRSYSAVDLFGLPSGSVPSVSQLQTIFNNYFSPIYLDTWQNLDLSLKPNVDDRIKFGGLNGEWIGMRPVGYRFSAYDLWNTYKDNVNSSNIDWDSINNGIIISAGQDVGTYRSIKITLPTAVTVDPVNFFANIIYNADGTPKGGVANQRIDTTVDMLPDNTENQRVVYDYKLQYSPTEGGALTTFKNFELNTPPFVDNSGNSNLDDAYNAAQRQKIVIRDFIIEFTLRRVIIE